MPGRGLLGIRDGRRTVHLSSRLTGQPAGRELQARRLEVTLHHRGERLQRILARSACRRRGCIEGFDSTQSPRAEPLNPRRLLVPPLTWRQGLAALTAAATSTACGRVSDQHRGVRHGQARRRSVYLGRLRQRLAPEWPRPARQRSHWPS